MPTPLSSVSPTGLWRTFAWLDRQALSLRTQALLVMALLIATWGLARGALMLAGDPADRLDQHLGVLVALLVMVGGLLHRRWYLVERPRWWDRVRASMVIATAPSNDDERAGASSPSPSSDRDD